MSAQLPKKPRQSGIITQILGSVIDVHFDGELPSILNALSMDKST